LELDLSASQASDAGELAALHRAVAQDLTLRFGHGHWSYEPTETSLTRAINTSYVLVARHGGVIIGSFELQTRKPWSIDRSYFAEVPRPLYLLAMAVLPSLQRQGIGRRLLDEAAAIARDWPAQAIRLDADADADADAGAGPFYARCGYRQVGRAVYRGTPLIYYERLL
jgi:GNAT superfamily N-acetyltransferase